MEQQPSSSNGLIASTPYLPFASTPLALVESTLSALVAMTPLGLVASTPFASDASRQRMFLAPFSLQVCTPKSSLPTTIFAMEGIPYCVLEGSPYHILEGSLDYVLEGSPCRILEGSLDRVLGGSPCCVLEGSPLRVLEGSTPCVPTTNNPHASDGSTPRSLNVIVCLPSTKARVMVIKLLAAKRQVETTHGLGQTCPLDPICNSIIWLCKCYCLSSMFM